MSSTLAIPAVLPRTLPDVRARLLAELGTVGIPNEHWPLETGEDCLAFLTWAAGIRERSDLSTSLIRISAFRATAGWHEVRGASELRPGDWALWDWDGDGTPDHATFVYSLDRQHDEITTVEANTGPHPGVLEPRGIYQKTRQLSSPELWGAERPQYLAPAVTSSDVRQVRAAATFLNRTMPATFHDHVTGRTIVLHRTGAGDVAGERGDGKRGPLYRLLVQVWGRMHRIYGDTYRLDGIFGPRCEHVVEPALFAAVKASR